MSARDANWDLKVFLAEMCWMSVMMQVLDHLFSGIMTVIRPQISKLLDLLSISVSSMTEVIKNREHSIGICAFLPVVVIKISLRLFMFLLLAHLILKFRL